MNKKARVFLSRGAQGNNLVGLFIFMVVVFVGMGMIKPETFFSGANFQSMGFQFPEVGLFAIGVMLPMRTGGMDLSMVGISNLSAIIAALIMIHGIPEGATAGQEVGFVVLAFCVACLVGLLCGLFNGFVITKFGTPPMIVTLGGQYLFMGLAVILTEGKPQLGFPKFFQEIGNGSVAGIPIPLILFVVVVAIMWYVLQKTPFGTKLYLIGSNSDASRYSGIKVDSLLQRTYGLTGLMAAIAGFILIARTNQANADYGTSYTLQSIMIAVLGGTSPNGGTGTVSGTVMAILTMQFISTGINMLGVSNVNFLRQLVWGVALLAVMAINLITENRRMKKALATTKNI